MLDFAILGLPRSRTAWLAAFLTTDSSHCWHEYSANVDKPSDFLNAMVPGKISGIADTGAALLGDDINNLVRRVVVIHRDVRESEASLARAFGVAVDMGWIPQRLLAIDGLHIAYNDLDNLESIASLWEYCLQSPFQRERFELFRGLNIQTKLDFFAQPLKGEWLRKETEKCLRLQQRP